VSKEAMLAVWELDVPHPEKSVLTVLAYSADKEGGSIYPSPAVIAKRTGYGRRRVSQIIDGLLWRQILEVVRHHPHYVAGRLAGYFREYRLTIPIANHSSESRANAGSDSPPDWLVSEKSGPVSTQSAPPSRNGQAPESEPQFQRTVSNSIENR
jgi:hypothetical protein